MGAVLTEVLSDEQVERLENARREGREAEVQEQIDRERAAAQQDAEFDAAAPEDTRSTRQRLDDLHAQETAETGVPSDVPGVDDGPGLDPKPDEAPSGQLSLGFSVGGKRPTSTAVRLMGGKIELPEAEFRKGDVRVFRVVAKVGAVEFVDERDKETRNVVGCQRRHKFLIEDIGLLDED